MANDSASSELSGSHKCKLLTKTTTNGDLLDEQKKKRLLSAVNNGVTVTLTKKLLHLPKQQPELQRWLQIRHPKIHLENAHENVSLLRMFMMTWMVTWFTLPQNLLKI